MSVYVFAVKNGEGVPDIKLLELMASRLHFSCVLCSPEEYEFGKAIAEALEIKCVCSAELSVRQSDETDRMLEVRMSRERKALDAQVGNKIVFLRPETMSALSNLPYLPEPGYTEVI